jgi:hypothetical protein
MRSAAVRLAALGVLLATACSSPGTGTKATAPPVATPSADPGEAREESAAPPAPDQPAPAGEEPAEVRLEPAAFEAGANGSAMAEAVPEPPCVELAAAIRERMASLQAAVEREPRESGAERELLEAIASSESFLVHCGASGEASLVKAFLGWALLRAAELPAGPESRLPKERLAQAARIRELGEEALSGAAAGSEERRLALSLLACALTAAEDLPRQRELAAELLAAFPEAPERRRVIDAVQEGYLREKLYEERAAFLEGVTAVRAADAEGLSRIGTLVDALHGAGRLEEMLELLEVMREQYSRLLSAQPSLQGEAQAWADASGFRSGQARLALGQIEAARAAFRENIAHLERREAALAESGVELPEGARILRDFRSRRLLAFIEEHYGERPEIDLEAEVEWATAETVSLERARGQVVAILFRPPGERTSESFLRELDRLARSGGGLVALTLSHLPGNLAAAQREQRLARLQADLAALDVKLAAGFDPTSGQTIFRRLGAVPGAPSLVVLDREGRFAWFCLSPGDLEWKTFERVAARLLTRARKAPARRRSPRAESRDRRRARSRRSGSRPVPSPARSTGWRHGRTLLPLASTTVPGEISRLAASQDGEWLVTGGSRMWVWRTASLEMVWSCEAHAFKVEDLKLTADAHSLVAVDAGGTARVWPLRKWQATSLRETTEELLWDAVFRPDGVLITESEALEFTAWDVNPCRGNKKADVVPHP